MFLNKYFLCAMTNIDLSTATISLALCSVVECAFIPLLYPLTHINTAPYFPLVIMDGFITIATYGCLPFYLMDEVQHGRINGGHARESFTLLTNS